MVWAVLRNYTYTGALVQGKTTAIRVGSTERRRTKKNQQFITENHHEGIVTHEEFEDAQTVIGCQKDRGFIRDAGFSLKGKVVCGNCKLKMMFNDGMAEVFIDEVVIYDSQKIEIRFLFDDLIAEMEEQIEREEGAVL